MRYILGALGIVVLLVIGIIVLSGLSGQNNSATRNTERKDIVLTDYVDKNSQVRLTILGRVVGNESRKAIRYTVAPGMRTQEVLSSYYETTTKREDLVNNRQAYEIFIHSLSNLEFTSEREVKNQDKLGACPFGNVYIYELINDGKGVLSSWSTSCNRREGTFAGNANSVRQLFQTQFPTYATFKSGTGL